MTEFRTPASPPRDPRRATVGWWGIGAVVAGIIAVAFFPAAVLGHNNYAMELKYSSPIWAICCCIGVATGIRGMQKQRYGTPRQSMIAFVGTMTCLITFAFYAAVVLMADV